MDHANSIPGGMSGHANHLSSPSPRPSSLGLWPSPTTEASFGDKLYYCPTCDSVRRFPPERHSSSILNANMRHTLCTNPGCRAIKGFQPPSANLPPESAYHCDAKLVTFTTTPPAYNIPYYIARQVMNRHLLGSNCGLPQGFLEADIRMASDPITWTQTWQPKIINDELYVSAVNTITERKACFKDRRTLRTAFGWIDDHPASRPIPSRISLCSHITAIGISHMLPCLRDEGDPSVSITSGRRFLFGIDSDSGSGVSQFTPCDKARGACPRCLMDFTTSIIWRPSSPRAPNVEESGRWQVVFTSYHQLGHCRTPEDWKWAGMNGSRWDGDGRPDTATFKAGSIWRRWDTALTEAEREQGYTAYYPD